MARTLCETYDNLIDNLIGFPVLVRTVTFHYLGLLKAVDDDFLLLENAAWLADSGRFGECLADGSYSEVEVYPDGQEPLISRPSVVDLCRWPHDLPRESK